MKTHLNFKDAGSVLYGLDISYHAHGEQKRGRQTIYGYFKVDRLTFKQRLELSEKYSNVAFAQTSPEYAPEQKRVAILFYTKAELKRLERFKGVVQ